MEVPNDENGRIAYDYLNMGGDADDYLEVFQDSKGNWYTVEDDEEVITGEFHPFQIIGENVSIEVVSRGARNTYEGDFHIVEHSGEYTDLPTEIRELLDTDDLDQGQWLMVINGELSVLPVGMHPSKIRLER